LKIIAAGLFIDQMLSLLSKPTASKHSNCCLILNMYILLQLISVVLMAAKLKNYLSIKHYQL